MANVPPTDHPRPSARRRVTSLVLLNTGDGKGKSSAAFGVVLRALARHWRVAVVQFIKSGEWRAGEETIGRQLGVDWFDVGDGFTWDSADLAHDAALARHGFDLAASIIDAGEHQLVVLDELTYLCTWGWLPVEHVVRCIENRPPHVNLVITGRDAPAELVEVADTVTEMRKIKHVYDTGVMASRGLDY